MSATQIIVHATQAPESTWQAIREWAIAFGTVGATFAAVYIGVWREWWRRPRLSLARGDVVPTAMTDGSRAAYATLQVRVAHGKVAAENAEVQVLSATEWAPRPGFPPSYLMPRINGQSLTWSDTDPATTRMTVAPGTHRPLDLVSIRKPEAAAGNAPAWIEVTPKPVGERHHCKSAAFVLELAVMADNAEPRIFGVTVWYDGEWAEGDAIGAHLRMEQPRRIKRGSAQRRGGQHRRLARGTSRGTSAR